MAENKQKDQIQEQEPETKEQKNERQPKKPYDPWQDMKEILVPKKKNGDQESIYCAVNGRSYLVPCTGRPQKVPAPIYEVLINSQLLQDEADERAAKVAERLRQSMAEVNMK